MCQTKSDNAPIKYRQNKILCNGPDNIYVTFLRLNQFFHWEDTLIRPKEPFFFVVCHQGLFKLPIENNVSREKPIISVYSLHCDKKSNRKSYTSLQLPSKSMFYEKN